MKRWVSAPAFLIAVALIPPMVAAAEAQKPTPPRTLPLMAAPSNPPVPAAAPVVPPPVAAPPKIRRTEIIAVDNWTVTCTLTDQPGAVRHCSADLKITQTDNNVPRVVFTWVIGSQDGKLLSILSMPTGVLITPGVQLSVGGKEVKKIGYSLCQPDRCEAIVPMDDAIIKDLSGAVTTDVSVYAVNGSGVKFTVNMKGFGEALADVNKS